MDLLPNNTKKYKSRNKGPFPKIYRITNLINEKILLPKKLWDECPIEKINIIISVRFPVPPGFSIRNNRGKEIIEMLKNGEKYKEFVDCSGSKYSFMNPIPFSINIWQCAAHGTWFANIEYDRIKYHELAHIPIDLKDIQKSYKAYSQYEY